MIGQHVVYSDPQGNTRAAIVVAVRDLSVGKVKLAIVDESGTWTTQDNIVRGTGPSTWRALAA